MLSRGTRTFIHADGRWRRDDGEAVSSHPVDVRIVTWNVWFGAHKGAERRAALLAEIERLSPDVVALQEVTPPLLEALLASPAIRDRYRASDVDLVQAYDVLLLSRLPVVDVDWIELPSRMGRRLLALRLACGLTVATVHLESTEACAEPRADQLGILQPCLLSACDDIVLVGDMNFAPEDAVETAALDGGFVDVWPELHARTPGYTVDTERNAMRRRVEGRPLRRRIDRIFVSSPRWRPTSISLLGTEPIDAEGTFISDHFGLEAVLAVDADG